MNGSLRTTVTATVTPTPSTPSPYPQPPRVATDHGEPICYTTYLTVKFRYLEECSSTLATTYSSGTPGQDASITTVDQVMHSTLPQSWTILLRTPSCDRVASVPAPTRAPPLQVLALHCTRYNQRPLQLPWRLVWRHWRWRPTRTSPGVTSR